jgi:hypothetical protein
MIGRNYRKLLSVSTMTRMNERTRIERAIEATTCNIKFHNMVVRKRKKKTISRWQNGS